MEVYAFNLMPYRHLDFEAARQHRALWTVLPNTLYDPERGADLYQEYIDQMVYAASLGFDGVCVNEHHQTAYGLMPAPNLIASILIDRTRGTNVKIPVIGRALPLVNNPLNIAEEFALLDNLSKGRLIAGFVRGIGCEYHATGVNPAFSHERFHEAHDLIVRAWTEDGPFSFEGKHFNFRYTNTWPRPYQRPRPDIWIPSQGSGETITWAAEPSRKYPFIITFSPIASVLKYHMQYRQQAETYGYAANGSQLGWAVPIYVAETDEIARKEAKAHIEMLFNTFLKVPIEMLFPPGYTSAASLAANLAGRQGMSVQDQTIDSLIEKGTFVVGSADTVVRQIKEAQAVSGFEKLIMMYQFGTLPDDLARKNLQLFAEDVMPQLGRAG
ncbi:MAG TPA: LLM class flavin-dependent oxidoreductase [Hyphomicrobium sp.]|nr:LLM class flavin-dependent oxidoreductase [Hyphomicrobium sp.]